MINFYFSKQISFPSMKAVFTYCACAISLDHLDFRLFMFGSHSRNQDEFTVSFISRRKFIVLFFEEAVRASVNSVDIIWIAVMVY